MYGIVMTLCSLARFFLLPNCLQMAMDFPDYSIYILVLAEPIIHLITYWTVGAYYQKGRDNPIKGSLLYCLFYFVHTGLFYLIGEFDFKAIAFVITIVVYAALHIGFAKIKRFLFGGV